MPFTTRRLSQTGVAFVFLSTLVSAARIASACSCMGRTPTEYVADADHVFIGRATTAAVVGADSVQRFDVFLTLKGKGPSAGPVARSPANQGGGCDRTFTPGEVALVFIKKGRASICDGNYDLSVMLPDMHEYLAASGAATNGSPDVVAKALALGQLGAALPRKGRVAVVLTGHQGKSVQVGDRTFAFVTAEPGALTVVQAKTHGPIHFVSIDDPARNVRSHLLVRDGARGLELLGEHLPAPKQKRP
jgi:hypothetical protein